MSTTLDNGQLTVSDIDATGKNNLLTVTVIGTDLVVSDANEEFIAAPAGGTLSNGNKTLTIPLGLITAGLTLNGGGGDDVVDINSVGAAFNANLMINGDAGADTVTFQTTAINLGTGSITVAAETINVNSAVSASGSLDLTSTGDDTLLAINAPVTAGADSKFIADKMLINSPVNVGVHMLTLAPENAVDSNDFIEIGALTDLISNTLQISDAELNRISATTIVIGDTNSSTVTISAAIQHMGDSHIQVVTGRNIVFNGGTSWATNHGDLSFVANQSATHAGNFIGIEVNNATLTSTGAGNIVLAGYGGNENQFNFGLFAHDGSAIQSTGTGKITMTGIGGTGTSDNRGVEIGDVGTLIAAVSGDIQITGYGGNTGVQNHGIYAYGGAVVRSTGTGQIMLNGFGGAGPSSNRGVELNDEGTNVTSILGDIRITGQGGAGTDSYNIGVWLVLGSSVSSTGTARIFIEGTGGSGTSENNGILLNGFGNGGASRVVSQDGDITIIGHGSSSATGSGNRGFGMYQGAVLQSSGSAKVLVDGTGGSGSDSARGVEMAYDGALITSAVGDIHITGHGGANTSGYGFWMLAGAVVESTGTAKVIIDGIGGDGSDGNGVVLNGSGPEITTRVVSSKDGDIIINGLGGNVLAGSTTRGIAVSNGAMVQSTGAARILLLGTGGTGVEGARGVEIGDASTKITSLLGDVQITGQGGFGLSGGGTHGVGVWIRDNALVESTATNGIAARITINGMGGAGSGADIGVWMTNSGRVSSKLGDIQITGQGASGGTGRYNFGVGLQGGSTIESTGLAKVTVEGNGGDGIGEAHGVYVVETNSAIQSLNGDIQITGHGGLGGNANIGVAVQTGGFVESIGAATVNVHGTGGQGTDSNYGVRIYGSDAFVRSAVGDIQIVGVGGAGTTNFNSGVDLQVGGSITSTGAARIDVTGTGGTGIFDAGLGVGQVGVWVLNSNSKISSKDGDIQITGIGGGDIGTSGNHGVMLQSGVIETTIAGTANVLVTGAPGFGSTSFGIQTQSDSANVGINTSVGTGNISLISDGINIDFVSQPASISAGTRAVTIRPKTSGTQINLGGADASGALGLTDAELDRITAGTLNIGDSSTGTIAVSADITRLAATNMQLVSGGDVEIGGGQLNVNGGSLLLDSGDAPDVVDPIHAGIDVAASTSTLGGDLSIVINGLLVDTTYTQLNVAGGINLSGVNLRLFGGYAPAIGDSFVIVNNDGGEAIVGAFNGLAEGAIIGFNGRNLRISYASGSDGNDVVLTAVNNVPQLRLNGGAETFSAKAARKGMPIHVVPNITVVDPDQSAAFGVGGGTLTVSIDVSAKTTRKGVKLHDTIGGLSNASTLGTTTGAAFDNGKLVLMVHLNASTTAAAIQSFLRGITFKTKGAGLKLAHRTFQAQVTDAAGAMSDVLQQMVNVTK